MTDKQPSLDEAIETLDAYLGEDVGSMVSDVARAARAQQVQAEASPTPPARDPGDEPCGIVYDFGDQRVGQTRRDPKLEAINDDVRDDFILNALADDNSAELKRLGITHRNRGWTQGERIL